MAKKSTKKSVSKKKQPIRMGIAGQGRAGWGMHLQEIQAKHNKGKYQVVAVSDVLKDRLDRAAQELGCKTYKDTYDLIQDPEVELVAIATRSLDHIDHAIAALKAGKHVFLEKPIAPSLAEAKRLVPAAKAAMKKSGAQLFIRHNRRFEPAFQHIKEIIDTKVLGEIYNIKLRRHSYQRRDDWQTIIEHGGGQLLNWGPHLIDHMLQFLDYDVADFWSDLQKVAAVGDAEDHVRLIAKNKKGLVIDVEISGGAAMGEPVYVVHGSKGALISKDEQDIELKYLNPKVKLKPRRAKSGTPEGFSDNSDLKWIEKTIPVKPASKADMNSIWAELYATLREKKKFPITLEQSLAVMEIAERAKQGTAFEMKKKKSKSKK